MVLLNPSTLQGALLQATGRAKIMAVPATRKEALALCLKNAAKEFRAKFGYPPEFASFAPGRVNLIGEHTDYNDGCVLPIALHLVTVVVGAKRPPPADKCRLLTTANVDEEKYDEFPVPDHPTKQEFADETLVPRSMRWSSYFKGVVALMNEDKNVPPFDAVIATCVPLGGGLSSSAALEVATCFFVEELCNRAGVSQPTRKPEEKALLCQKAEHMYAHVPCGIMDQFVSVMGQQSKALFIDCRRKADKSFDTEAAPFPPTENILFLVTDTRVKHNLGASEYPKRKRMCQSAAEKLGKTSLREANMEEVEGMEQALTNASDNPTEYMCSRHVVGEINRTKAAIRVLEQGDYASFGQLMNESHTALSTLYKVSCNELDRLVELARTAPGVFGSRMTGGGFGGCTVTLVKEECCEEAIRIMNEGYVTENGEKAIFYKAVPSSGAGVVSNADLEAALKE